MCYDIISLTSLKIIQALHLLLGFADNQGVLWDFKIQNSVRITEGSDNGDSDNRGSTVLVYNSGNQNVLINDWYACLQVLSKQLYV